MRDPGPHPPPPLLRGQEAGLRAAGGGHDQEAAADLHGLAVQQDDGAGQVTGRSGEDDIINRN